MSPAPPPPPPSGQPSGANKAYLEIERGHKVPCLFNPAQLEISRSNSWSAPTMPGRGVVRLRYAGSRAGWLRVPLFFDTTDTGKSVTIHTDKILALMDIDTSLPGTDDTSRNGRPPYVIFHWGSMHSFKAVVADLTLTYTYFSSTGTPLRATMDLTMRQYEPDRAFGPQNPTSGTPQPHQVHRVQAGETLDRIAAQYYGDAGRWRLLASANSLVDPLALKPGSLLSVPRIDA